MQDLKAIPGVIPSFPEVHNANVLLFPVPLTGK